MGSHNQVSPSDSSLLNSSSTLLENSNPPRVKPRVAFSSSSSSSSASSEFVSPHAAPPPIPTALPGIPESSDQDRPSLSHARSLAEPDESTCSSTLFSCFSITFRAIMPERAWQTSRAIYYTLFVILACFPIGLFFAKCFKYECLVSISSTFDSLFK